MPFYQFNPFTGRLKESTRTQPLYPISPVPLQRSEPPTMIYDSVHTKPAKVGSAFQKAGASTLSSKFQESFKVFQSDLEKPVFMLAGKKDKLLFGLTCVAIAGCSLQAAYFVGKSYLK